MSDYSDLLARARAALMDLSGVVWLEAQIQEGMLQALADMRQAANSAYIVNGLAGETAATTLPAAYFSLLVRGCTGFCLAFRLGDRSNAFSFEQGLSETLMHAATAHLVEFRRGIEELRSLRVKDLQTAAQPPFPLAEDDAPGWTLPEVDGF